MQTFLPYADFTQSAKVLDYRRLGKQRLEAWQLLQSQFYGGGWVNHPASKMWRGHSIALAHYGLAVCQEWQARGYIERLGCRFRSFLSSNPDAPLVMPPWLGDPLFHRAHQSNLVRKNSKYYSPLFVGVPSCLEYIWPKIDAPRGR